VAVIARGFNFMAPPMAALGFWPTEEGQGDSLFDFLDEADTNKWGEANSCVFFE
jgi:hypothetical protein